MQKTKEAIKYGLTTMGVTTKEMFSLIESSNGYTGEDNNRWLAGQIIKIAEADGVGYSQLLSKWFNIISSIEEESSDMTIKSIWVSKIQSFVGSGSVYTVGMGAENEFGTELSDVDWFDGLDIAWNAWFSDEKLPKDMAEALHEGDPVTIIINTDVKLRIPKGSSLLQDAKSNGVPCSNAGALMMYRVCNMLSAMEVVGNFKVILVSDTAFLLDKENAQIIKYFLNMFSYDGFVINSMDLYESSFTSKDFAVIECTPRSSDVQDGILLPVVEGDKIGSTVKRYSPGGSMWGKIRSESASLLDCDVKALNKDMSISTEIVKGCSEALGYICVSSNSSVPELTTLPVHGTEYIPITMGNIGDIVVYYGVVNALHNSGLSCDIPEILSGHPEYDMLVSNCVPVFLFGTDSKFKSYPGVAENKFDVIGSELVSKMLDRSSQYFGYETKELMDICKGFIDYVDTHDCSMIGSTFEEIRVEANNSDLNKSYITALCHCLGYLGTQYRRML